MEKAKQELIVTTKPQFEGSLREFLDHKVITKSNTKGNVMYKLSLEIESLASLVEQFQ